MRRKSKMAEDEKKEVTNEEIVIEDREFTTFDGRIFTIKAASSEGIRKADLHYSKIYSTCLVEDIVTAAELMDELKRRGIAGPEYQARAEELEQKIADKLKKLENEDNRESKQTIAREIEELREEILQWNQRINGPMSNTCEQISEDARLDYLTSCMVYDEKGNRAWASYKDYLDSEDKALTFKSRFEIMLYMQGLPTNFLDNTPERTAMREIQEEVLSELNASLEDAGSSSEESKAEEVKPEEVEASKPEAEKKPKKVVKKRSAKKTGSEK